MVSPKVIFPAVHALHSRPRPAAPSSARAPSHGKRASSLVLSASEFIVGAETSHRDTHWEPTILHFPVVNYDKKAKSFLGFCLRTFYTYICIYVCVCMDICMYMHMYMYICIYPSQYKYSRRESCKYSLVTCLSASRCHIFNVTLTTPFTD